MDPRQKMVEDEDGRRIKGDDHGSDDQADGIDKVHHLKSHESRNDGKDKDTVAESPERLIVELFGPSLFPKEDTVEKIDDSPHRAEPSAEEVAEDDHKEKYPEGGKHPHDDILLGENRDDTDKGVQTEVEINGDLQSKGEGGFENKIDKK